MNLLFLIPSHSIKGPIYCHTMHLLSSLRSLGCKIATHTWGRHSDSEFLLQRIVSRTLDIISIRRTLRNERFDMLVVKTAHDWRTLVRDIALLLVVRRICPRIVLQFHGSNSQALVLHKATMFTAATKILLRLSDAALVLSSEEQRQFEHFYPQGKFYKVDNPFIPADKTLFQAVESAPISLKCKPVLLFVGMITAAKGILDLLNAMPLILKHTACHLVIAGDGPQMAQVKRSIEELGLANEVSLMGYLSGDQVLNCYRRADIFVLPTYHGEGFPTVITEAMDAGLPIVTTCIRGAADHLVGGVNALFVPPRNHIVLSDTILRLLNDPDLCICMGKANKEKVNTFAPDIVGEKYFNVLKEVSGLNILMLVPSKNIRGPISKIAGIVSPSLRSLGCKIATHTWGRHSDSEFLLQRIVSRTLDIISIRRTLRNERFDMLVVKTAHDWRTLVRDIALLLVVRRMCPRIVLRFHGSNSQALVLHKATMFTAATKILLRLTDAALVLSSEEQRQFEHFYPQGKFYKVDNPFIPADKTLFQAVESAPISLKCKPVLLFVGMITAAKGILDLLNAMPLILKHTACHLVIAGDGPQMAQVKRSIEELGLANEVSLMGYLSGDQVLNCYRRADIFVLPTYHGEGFPTVITEAMDAGLPIVTTCIRGAADHLEDGTNAIFVPPKNPTAVADALVRLLADKALCQRMAQANRNKVLEFSPDRVGRQYLDVLEKVVGA